jgi:hypothetical protein
MEPFVGGVVQKVAAWNTADSLADRPSPDLTPALSHYKRQWVGKTVEIFGKHVNFAPHPKSLQGAIPPSKEEQEKFGFCDISTAIVDTLEAICNAPQSKGKSSIITHDELGALLETAIVKRNDQLKSELKT